MTKKTKSIKELEERIENLESDISVMETLISNVEDILEDIFPNEIMDNGVFGGNQEQNGAEKLISIPGEVVSDILEYMEKGGRIFMGIS